MVSKIQEAAELSVARACGFAALAIVMMMLGFSGDPPEALKCGGLGALLVCIVLVLKAFNARSRNVKSTETWIMLKPEDRPSMATAQQVIGTVLREVYLRFALQACLIAVGLLAFAVIASVWLTRIA
jgi:Ca2+/Na+ antiporter